MTKFKIAVDIMGKLAEHRPLNINISATDAVCIHGLTVYTLNR